VFTNVTKKIKEGSTEMNLQNEETIEDSLDIAIIGMSLRFPGAKTVEEYWNNLKSGKQSITFHSEEELIEAGVNPDLLKNKNYVKAGSLLEDIDLFDAPFFNYSPREAEMIDPQQRVLLEGAWEALEHAGYDPRSYGGLIGVYTGTGLNTYLLHLLNDQEKRETLDSLQLALANDKDYLATRISYKLNLKGPSMSVQTACSTSLVAVHLACQSLQNFDTDIALAGGVSIRVPQRAGYLYQEGSILSPDGYCRAFDANANGTVFGNGMGLVVLKRLADARNDGDCIHAVIKGTAINNDGSYKVGFTAPSVEGQAKVIEDAIQIAGVEKDSISYIEAHGTGTTLGDPIEIEALQEVYKGCNQIKIGSVKTNIGHLDTAAGIAGLIKTVLALKYKQLPQTLNYEKENPQIKFEQTAFEVNQQLTDWRKKSGVRRAGVSSFGMGGTNAHVILEEAPSVTSEESTRDYQLITLSAQNDKALADLSSRMEKFLTENEDTKLADVAYTTQLGRSSFDKRKIIIAKNHRHATEWLGLEDHPLVITGGTEQKNDNIVFMFTGQGAQYVNMTKELYEQDPLYRKYVDDCFEILRSVLDLDLRKVMYPDQHEEEDAKSLIDQTQYTQPALFVIEYALAQYLQDLGIKPKAMIGHSVGEYVAACLAGVFTLEDGLQMIAKRAELMQKMPLGSMVAVPLSEVETCRRIQGMKLSLAAINAPQLCVVSGADDEIKKFTELLESESIGFSNIQTSHAFHSWMMDAVMEEFTAFMNEFQLNEPSIPYISNVTGTWMKKEQVLDPRYYSQQLRDAVRFSQGIDTLRHNEGSIFIEVGPDEVLSKIVKRSASRDEVILSAQSAKRTAVESQHSNQAQFVKLLGECWIRGMKINWNKYYQHESRLRVPLPTYPFQRERYWIEAMVKQQSNTSEKGKKANISDWFYVPTWKRINSFQQSNLEHARFLILEHGHSFIEEIKGYLFQSGHDVVTVTNGERFELKSPKQLMINSNKSEDYNTLIKYLANEDMLPQFILHGWTLSDDSLRRTSELDIDSTLKQAQDKGFNSLIYLAQAIEKANISTEMTISVLTNGLFDVTGFENLYPEKALVLGPVKAIQQESRNLSSGIIDVDFTDQSEGLISNIINGLNNTSAEQMMAYRGKYRWIQTYEAIRMDKDQGELPLREKGTYLITGGLGGLGLLFAKYIAEQSQGQLVLVSRREFPPREQWNEKVLADETDMKIKNNIKRIQEIEELGSEVYVYSVDVTSEHELQELLLDVKTRFGNINGVLHAAGVPGAGLLMLKTPEMAQKVLAPKVKGTMVLGEYLKDEPLDFFLLFSSTLSITGGLGQIDYVSANAFLDAYAHASYRNNQNVQAINWDAWQIDSWQANAFSSKLDIQNQIKELREAYGIKDNEGLQAADIALRSRLPQVIVSTKDLAETIYKHQFYTDIVLNRDSQAEDEHQRQLDESSYIAPRNDVEEAVAAIWKEVLGIDRIGVKDNFIDLGGHSLLAVQLISRIRENFDIDIPLQAIFNYPTVENMSELVFETILNEVESISVGEIEKVLENGEKA
jgi:phthiocerol/phenolphthiocerol synthesis type-I polyketide synthase E